MFKSQTENVSKHIASIVLIFDSFHELCQELKSFVFKV